MCQPRTLYVAGSGDDAVSYAENTRTRPWRTIGRAAWGSTSRSSPDAIQAAQAGDTVVVSPGVDWEDGDPRGGRFTVSLNPVNSGTPGAPITFRLDSHNLDNVAPLFVDAANGNYRLRPGSPARTLGRDVLNLTGQGGMP